MAKTTLPNSLSFFKKIKKLTLSLTCMSLLTFSAQASMNLKDLTDSTRTFITQRVIQPLSDLNDDINNHIERASRSEPSNYFDLILQKTLDFCEDFKIKVERKIIRPIENLIENL